ncbi:hypothetical protein D3C85_1382650 [compost metagenome]
MDINYTPAELEFRDEVRAFLSAAVPDDIAAKVRLGKHLDKEDHLRWQGVLARRGWYAANWPVEQGVLAGAWYGATSSRRSAPRSVRRG